MSIFPRHVRPSRTVTVHCRVTPLPAPSSVGHRWLRGAVIDPLGRETVVIDRQVFLAPPMLVGATTPPLHHLADAEPSEAMIADLLAEAAGSELHGLPPAQLAARLGELGLARLGRDELRRLLASLVALRASTHHYGHFDVPADAPLGRYRLELATAADGRIGVSETASGDHFFVEDLNLVEVAEGGATVHNPSPEPTEVTLVGIDGAAGERRASPSRHTLPPRSTTRLVWESRTAFLVYAEGGERIHLGAPADAPVLRAPPLAWHHDRERGRVRLRIVPRLAPRFAHGSTGGRGGALAAGEEVWLDREESEVWLLADGLGARSTAARAGDDALRRLEADGLIIGLDGCAVARDG